MSRLTDTFNSLALKLGQVSGLSGSGKLAGIGAGSLLFKILLLVVAVLIGSVLLSIWLALRRIANIGRNALRWIVAEPVLTLLILASAVMLSFAGWMVYDHLQECRITIAAGFRTTESYALAQALKTVTERHYPRIRITILEIEDATGLLENGLAQLATAQSDTPARPNIRSVAALTPQSLLLARNDVDKGVVYALTQTLLQRGPELSDAIENAEFRPLAAKVQKPGANSKPAAPLHTGAAAFYERDKTWFVFRDSMISALTFAGLILGGLWVWGLRRRLLRKRQAERKRQEQRFAGLAERAPWSLSKLLLEIEGQTSQQTLPPV